MANNMFTYLPPCVTPNMVDARQTGRRNIWARSQGRPNLPRSLRRGRGFGPGGNGGGGGVLQTTSTQEPALAGGFQMVHPQNGGFPFDLPSMTPSGNLQPQLAPAKTRLCKRKRPF